MRYWFQGACVLGAVVSMALFGVPGTAAAQESPPPDQEEAVPPPPMTPQVVLSPQAAALLQDAVGGTMVTDVALKFRPFYFPSMQGGTLSMMGIRVGTGMLMYGADTSLDPATVSGPLPEFAKMELFGSVLQDGAEVLSLGAVFDVPKEGGAGGFSDTMSFGDTLQPGTYDIVWGVRDTIGGRAGTHRATLQVPDFMTGDLMTSSVMMVTGGPWAAPGTFQSNTVYQGIRVLTRLFGENLDRAFDRSLQQVMVAYIVMGAQIDPATQAFNLEIAYRVLNAAGESILRIEPQASPRTTIGQPIPLSQIEGLEAGGEYRFEITIKDLAAGTETVVEVPFSIAS